MVEVADPTDPTTDASRTPETAPGTADGPIVLAGMSLATVMALDSAAALRLLVLWSVVWVALHRARSRAGWSPSGARLAAATGLAWTALWLALAVSFEQGDGYSWAMPTGLPGPTPPDGPALLRNLDGLLLGGPAAPRMIDTLDPSGWLFWIGAGCAVALIWLPRSQLARLLAVTAWLPLGALLAALCRLSLAPSREVW